MELEVYDTKKMVCVWLTHADQENAAIQEQLKSLYLKYKQRKYCVAVFRSGHEDLEGLTRDLLQYNRKRTEEINMAAEKKKAKIFGLAFP